MEAVGDTRVEERGGGIKEGEREKKKEKKIEGMREERAGSGGAPTRKEEGEFLV
jgi:hypothetical protein